MSKLNANAERKGGKRQKQEADAPDRKPSRGDRYPYDRKCCAQVEKLGADGLCAVEIRREIGIPRSVWKRWIEQFPEFAEAVDEADDAAQAYWLNIGRKSVMLGAGFSSNTYIFLMKNKWPKIYRDRQDHSISGPNDGPIVSEIRAPDLASIADPREALKQFEAFRASLALAAPAQTKH